MNGIEPGFDTQESGAQLPDSYRSLYSDLPCDKRQHLAQHVHFEELPSGFDSGSRSVVVFFYNRPVVMEKAS